MYVAGTLRGRPHMTGRTPVTGLGQRTATGHRTPSRAISTPRPEPLPRGLSPLNRAEGENVFNVKTCGQCKNVN